VEVCDGIDQDCDGDIDGGAADATTWFADADEDGYGDPTLGDVSCDAPTGWVADASDCDDTDALVAPGADEHCEGTDEDCDGWVDNDPIDATWYEDADGDGYGDASTEVTTCTPPTGAVSVSGDCDDEDDSLSPGAVEACDGLDQDCDDAIDDGATCDCEQVNEGGHSYLFCQDEVTWADAELACIEYGYLLVSLDDADENVWVSDTAYAWSYDEWWTGYNDTDIEGAFTWANGSLSTYTEFHSGEPNNVADEDCVPIGRWDDYTWNDADCGELFQYICEAD
jgi:hypothetical protein